MIASVHINQIPSGDLLHLEGEADPAELDLPAAGVRPLGPLHYSLDIGLSQGGIFATGRLSIRAEFTCVATLQPFEKEIVIDEFALQKDLPGTEEVDLTEEIREDIQLALPAYPRIESAGEVRLPEGNGAGGNLPDCKDPWKALDKFNTHD